MCLKLGFKAGKPVYYFVMAQVVRDFLSTTGHLFDKSGSVNEELQKISRNPATRAVLSQKEELSKIVVAGLDSSSLNLLRGGQEGVSATSVLQTALSDCRSTAASIKSLLENRDEVCDARAEAIRHHEQTARENREKLTEELRESKT